MNKSLKAIAIICLGVFISASVMAEGPDKKMPPGDNPAVKPPQGEQAISEAQAAKIKSILSAYNPAQLTAADAKAIHNAFREAGIKKGPGMIEAIKAAGFDHEKLRTLDPPPEVPGGKNPENK